MNAFYVRLVLGVGFVVGLVFPFVFSISRRPPNTHELEVGA